jgi:hypothetical protein
MPALDIVCEPDLTPGAYLRRCREKLGLTAEMLALGTETDPAICARDRAELLEAIEADLVPVSVRTGRVLQLALGFDPDTLDALIERHDARSAPSPVNRPAPDHPIEFTAVLAARAAA